MAVHSTVAGGRRLRYRVRDLAVPGGSRRVLGLDWGSASSGDGTQSVRPGRSTASSGRTPAMCWTSRSR